MTTTKNSNPESCSTPDGFVPRTHRALGDSPQNPHFFDAGSKLSCCFFAISRSTCTRYFWCIWPEPQLLSCRVPCVPSLLQSQAWARILVHPPIQFEECAVTGPGFKVFPCRPVRTSGACASAAAGLRGTMLVQAPPNSFQCDAAGKSSFRRMGGQYMYESTNVLQMGANFTALLGFITILRQMLPRHYLDFLMSWAEPLLNRMNRFAYFKVPEMMSHNPNELYDAVQSHLSATTAKKASRASLVRSKRQAKTTYIVSSASGWILEVFDGEPVWWKSSVHYARSADVARPDLAEPRRSFQLKIHKRNKEKILNRYLDHIIRSADLAKHASRERQLFTNSGKKYPWITRKWSSVPFHHPSTFDTLALDPGLKKEIIDDLEAFVKSEDFYRRVGRAWKRGYLLYGPPGTGKSSMIAAMANLVGYDIYDLELTSVKDNSELRQLLLQTTSKSIIVIEDIDCTIQLTNRAKEEEIAEKKTGDDKDKDKDKDDDKEKKKKKEKEKEQGVTLSGLLNFTDGIWSCCGSEKIMVFTTNHIDKLDPALLRTGRMDMKIHLSYCSFPAFKVLASNYLNIQDHQLYDKVEEAFQGSQMTPADVTEYFINSKSAETSLERLIAGLEKSKLPALHTEDTTSPEKKSPGDEARKEVEKDMDEASKGSQQAGEHQNLEISKEVDKKEEQKTAQG